MYENGNKNKSELPRKYGKSEGNVRTWIKKYGKIKTSTGETTLGMIFHSDLGSQYTLNKFEELLLKNSVRHSYSKKSYPYDNASMESFNAILKKEEINVNTYETFDEARKAIFEFIESWHNNIRILFIV